MRSLKLGSASFALFSITVLEAVMGEEVVLLTGGMHNHPVQSPDGIKSGEIYGQTMRSALHIRSVEVFGQAGCSPSLTLPDNREGHTSNYIDGQVLICGGQATISWTQADQRSTCLQLVDGEFIAHSQLKEGRVRHAGVMLKGKLSLIGGNNRESMETLDGTTWTLSKNKVEHGDFDASRCYQTLGSDTWKCSRGTDESSCVVALDNTHALVIGGRADGRIVTDDVSEYDTEGGWTTKESLPERRYAHSCVLLENGKVLVAGGSDGINTFDSAVIYSGDSWEKLPGRLNSGRFFGQMVKMNGRILYFGGIDEKFNTLDTIEEFDEETGSWTLLQQKMKTPRDRFSAVVVPASTVGCRT